MRMVTADGEGRVGVVLNRPALLELSVARGIMSDTELAEVIGTSKVTLWRVGTGKVLPSNELIARVLQAFPEGSFDTLFTVKVL